MKFNCGPTRAEKKALKEQWHDWFAWRPIMVGSHDCRWLETIQRKGTYYVPDSIVDMYLMKDLSNWSWKYRGKST